MTDRTSWSPPAGAVDAHAHVIGPKTEFPLTSRRAYTPPDAPVEALAAMLDAVGLSRVVLVQPSIYGADNACMLAALDELGDRARGVAVLERAASAELDALHGRGVRGLRLNFATLGVRDPAAARAAIKQAVAMAERNGWHVQIHAPSATALALESDLVGLRPPVVLDHFGGLSPTQPQAPETAAVLRLLAAGLWIKVSARYRLPNAPPIGDAARLVRRLVDENPSRILWGSDWPHTPAHAGVGAHAETGRETPFQEIDAAAELGMLAPLDPRERRGILIDNPRALYEFAA